MKIITESSQQTEGIGKKIAKSLKPSSVIALFGNLGSGKTTFVKGLAAGLGIDKDSVNSPSFVLVKEYKSRPALYHFDLYRLRNEIDVFNIGYEEYLAREGIVVIEWADRIKDALPKDYLKINFLFCGENKRELTFIAHGRDYREIVKKICKS